ncbi:hypothetical protein D3C86_2013460 [compost metagenome]
MAKCAQAVAPLCYEAFEEHILHAQRFSRSEMEALRALLRGGEHALTERQAAEFEKKLWGESGQPAPTA